MPTFNKLGPYHCIRTLGEGTFAQVVLGKDERTKELVALKVIKHTMDRIDQRRAQYLQTEVGIMRKLDHKHVIGLKEVRREEAKKRSGKMETVIVMVFEYAAGGELYETLYLSSTFEDPVARTYFHQLVLGLAYCHDLKIAHRDLKPQNLLLDGWFNLKIGDFGFAKLLDNQAAIMHTNCGTPAYQAPELRDSEKRRQGYTVAADIWACGIILFFMLTGRTPFQRAELTDPTCQYLFRGEYEKFWEVHTIKTGSFFSLITQDFINKMLTVDPARRITVHSMTKHPWFNGPLISHDSLVAELKRRREVVKQKKKRAKLKQRAIIRNTGSSGNASPLLPNSQHTGSGQATNLPSTPGLSNGSQTPGLSTPGLSTGVPSAQPSGTTFSGNNSIERAVRGFRRMETTYKIQRELCALQTMAPPQAMDEDELEFTKTYFECKETVAYILWRIRDELKRMTGDEDNYAELRAKVPGLADTDWLEFGNMESKDVERLLDTFIDTKTLDEDSKSKLSDSETLLKIHDHHSRTSGIHEVRQHSDEEAKQGIYHFTFTTQGALSADTPLEIRVQIYTKEGENTKALDGSPLHIVQFKRHMGDGFEYLRFYDYLETKLDDLVYLEEDEKITLALAEEEKRKNGDDDESKGKLTSTALARVSLYSSTPLTPLSEHSEEERQEQRLKETDDGVDGPSYIPVQRSTYEWAPKEEEKSYPQSNSLTVITASPPTSKRPLLSTSQSVILTPSSSGSPPTIIRRLDAILPGPHSASPLSSQSTLVGSSRGSAGPSPDGPMIQRSWSVPISPLSKADGHPTLVDNMRPISEETRSRSSIDQDSSPEPPALGGHTLSYSPLAPPREMLFSMPPLTTTSVSSSVLGYEVLTSPLTPSGSSFSSAPTSTATISSTPVSTSVGGSEPSLFGKENGSVNKETKLEYKDVRPQEKKELNVALIWNEVEKKLKVVDEHIQWSDIVSCMNEAINLLFITLYPAYVPHGATFFTAQEGEEFKKIRGGFAGTKIPLSEYKFLWLGKIETYLKTLLKIPHTWFGTPRVFHGPMSRDRSQQLLSTCKSGTLIVRYSCKNSGLCFSSRRSDGQVQHLELKLSADGSTLSIQWDKEIRRRFTSLEAIVWQSPLYLSFYPDLPKATILNPQKEKDR